MNFSHFIYFSEDPEDLSALILAMLLKETTESGLPDLDLMNSQKVRKKFKYRPSGLEKSIQKGTFRIVQRLFKDSSIAIEDSALVDDNNVQMIN